MHLERISQPGAEAGKVTSHLLAKHIEAAQNQGQGDLVGELAHDVKHWIKVSSGDIFASNSKKDIPYLMRETTATKPTSDTGKAPKSLFLTSSSEVLATHTERDVNPFTST
eukprot:3567459-Amphidinium_carterae.1